MSGRDVNTVLRPLSNVGPKRRGCVKNFVLSLFKSRINPKAQNIQTKTGIPGGKTGQIIPGNYSTKQVKKMAQAANV